MCFFGRKSKKIRAEQEKAEKVNREEERITPILEKLATEQNLIREDIIDLKSRIPKPVPLTVINRHQNNDKNNTTSVVYFKDERADYILDPCILELCCVNSVRSYSSSTLICTEKCDYDVEGHYIYSNIEDYNTFREIEAELERLENELSELGRKKVPTTLNSDYFYRLASEFGADCYKVDCDNV